MVVAHAKPYENPSGLRKMTPEEKSKYDLRLNYVSTDGWMPYEFTKLASKLSSEYNYVFLGHTHKQHHVDAEKFGHNVLIVNPGSVGQGKKGTYSIVDTEDNTVKEKTVDIHKDSVNKKMKEEGSPETFF